MNKQQIIQELKKAATAAFHKADGSLNYYAIKKATGLTHGQINSIFDESKKPTFDTIHTFAQAIGKPLKV